MHVELKNVNRSLGEGTAAWNLSLVIQRGDLIGILGPKCSGKTTILKMIAGLVKPESGDVFFDGVRITNMKPCKRRVSYISPNYVLFRFMTIYENISMSMEYKDVIKSKKDRRVLEVLRILDIKGMEDLYPYQLTKEERQLAIIAKEVAANPRLLLFDEPFMDVDKDRRMEIKRRLRRLIDKMDIPGIIVTSSPEEAMDIANRIIITRAGKSLGYYINGA